MEEFDGPGRMENDDGKMMDDVECKVGEEGRMR